GAAADDPAAEARLALAEAELAVARRWYTGADATSAVERACAVAGELDAGATFDLGFLQLRRGYGDALFRGDRSEHGPAGKDPAVLADLRRQGQELRDTAPDAVRRGWAEMYLGLIADNLLGERDLAPSHYEAALAAGEGADDYLTWEALRH